MFSGKSVNHLPINQAHRLTPSRLCDEQKERAGSLLINQVITHDSPGSIGQPSRIVCVVMI